MKFAGSQSQRDQRTVQGTLEDVLAKLFGRPTAVTLAGRTDAGVHAAGQVASCDDWRAFDTVSRLSLALSAHLPEDLTVLKVERVAAGFHARYDARWREYRYRVWSGGRAPLARGAVWERRDGLDLAAMRAGATRLVGRRDFASFAGGGEGVPWSERQSKPGGTTRTVMICDCRALPPWWMPTKLSTGTVFEIRVVADGFLPRMVRTMTGTLVEVGRGKREPVWIDEALAARDRRTGLPTAPAHGLTLWRVGYDNDRPDDW